MLRFSIHLDGSTSGTDTTVYHCSCLRWTTPCGETALYTPSLRAQMLPCDGQDQFWLVPARFAGTPGEGAVEPMATLVVPLWENT